MTAATVTEQPNLYIPGVKIGTISAANDYTTTFGFAKVYWAIVNSSSDDDAIATVAVSSGSGTIGLVDDAGAAVTGATTINFIAFGE